VKDLQLNPQNYEIILGHASIDDGVTTINFTFNDTCGEIAINSGEAKKIGEWFLKLSKELDR